MNCFPYKETHFFAFIQFSLCIAQLCNLVAHLVGSCCTCSAEDFKRRGCSSGSGEIWIMNADGTVQTKLADTSSR